MHEMPELLDWKKTSPRWNSKQNDQSDADEFWSIKSITSRIQKTDKYLMKTYRALVRVQTRGRTNYVKTEVRAESQQDARWLLWAQYGFHSIYSGPDVVNTRRAAWSPSTRCPSRHWAGSTLIFPYSLTPAVTAFVGGLDFFARKQWHFVRDFLKT